MADAELEIAERTLRLLRSAKPTKGNPNLAAAAEAAFESLTGVAPRDERRYETSLAIETLITALSDGESSDIIREHYHFALSRAEAWLAARA
jgi:hypothetical protein